MPAKGFRLSPFGGIGEDVIWNETPTGAVNGANTDFTLAYTPKSTSNMLVFVNGMLMQLTTDYTVAGAVITFGTAPPTGSIIMVTYQK